MKELRGEAVQETDQSWFVCGTHELEEHQAYVCLI